MRFSWAWLTVLSCSHVARDWFTDEPATPLSSEVVELRIQVESTHQNLKVRDGLVRAADSRLFWQGLVLKFSIFVDIFLGLLALWLWLKQTSAVLRISSANSGRYIQVQGESSQS
jgi:hypothetical protein